MVISTQTHKIGDCIELLRNVHADSIDVVITSPPYYMLRDYGVDGQIGMEPTVGEYHDRLLAVTSEIKRVMKPSGVLFWNHGDSYGGHQGRGKGKGNERDQMILQKKPGAKCLMMQNERLIMRMIDEHGFILRNRIIWNKSNGMPSSVSDRFSNKYEPIYMLVKREKYWFDLDTVRVDGSVITKARQSKPTDCYGNGSVSGETARYAVGIHHAGKNPGDVWTIPTHPYPESHFATFPPDLIEPLIKAACPAEICPVCGHIRERIVKKEVISPRTTNGIKNSNTKYYVTRCGDAVKNTVGWTSCDCNGGWVSGTVLDPFCGSGTVLEVCRKLNRNAIGFELNPNYEPLIRKRSMAHTPPLETFCNQEK